MSPKTHLRFNFRRSVQAVAFLLRKTPGSRMNYMRLLKLLYIAERESLLDAGGSIAGGRIAALPRGPVMEDIYALVRGVHIQSPEWSQFFHTENYHLVMHSDPGMGSLTPFIAKKLNAIAERYEEDDEWSMVEITHQLPEWKKNDPGTSSNPIHLKDILDALGIPEELDFILEGDSNSCAAGIAS